MDSARHQRGLIMAKMTKNDKFFVAVRGIAIKDSKILLVKESEEWVWETPGGRIKKMESIEDGLKREFLEETGYTIKVIKPLYAYNRKKYKTVLIIYLVELDKKVSEPEEDIIGNRWFSKAEIKDMIEKNKADVHDIIPFGMFVKGELE